MHDSTRKHSRTFGFMWYKNDMAHRWIQWMQNTIAINMGVDHWSQFSETAGSHCPLDFPTRNPVVSFGELNMRIIFSGQTGNDIFANENANIRTRYLQKETRMKTNFVCEDNRPNNRTESKYLQNENVTRQKQTQTFFLQILASLCWR